MCCRERCAAVEAGWGSVVAGGPSERCSRCRDTERVWRPSEGLRSRAAWRRRSLHFSASSAAGLWRSAASRWGSDGQPALSSLKTLGCGQSPPPRFAVSVIHSGRHLRAASWRSQTCDQQGGHLLGGGGQTFQMWDLPCSSSHLPSGHLPKIFYSHILPEVPLLVRASGSPGVSRTLCSASVLAATFTVNIFLSFPQVVCHL